MTQVELLAMERELPLLHAATRELLSEPTNDALKLDVKDAKRRAKEREEREASYVTLPCITLHYTTLHYTTLHCTALHYTTLRYTTTTLPLHYITLHYIALHHIALHDTTLHYITLHDSTLHYSTAYYITLHYMTLHYITLRTSHPSGARTRRAVFVSGGSLTIEPLGGSARSHNSVCDPCHSARRRKTPYNHRPPPRGRAPPRVRSEWNVVTRPRSATGRRVAARPARPTMM